jgi:hypothetical protein
VIKCESCGSDDLELESPLPDGRKQIRCSQCGHSWIRGEPRTVVKASSRFPQIDIEALPIGDASWGLAQRCIRGVISDKSRLETFSEDEPFLVDQIDDDNVVLLLAEKHRTPIAWDVWEGALKFIHGRGSVRVGGGYTVDGEAGTLDGFLKQHVQRAVSGWVAVVLETAGLIHLNRDRPATVKLTDQAKSLIGS